MDIQAAVDTFATERTHLSGFDLPDPIAMAVALDPHVATDTRFLDVVVETEGRYSDGQTVVDHLGIDGRPPNVHVVVEASRSDFLRVLHQTLAGRRRHGQMSESSPFRPGIPDAIRVGGVVAIGRRIDAAAVGGVIDGLSRGGVRAFELTLNDPEADALAAIAAAARHAAGTDVAIGAGTVLSIEAAARALEAGASFLVMPHTDPDARRLGRGAGCPGIPRREHADRGPDRVASGRGSGEALPGVRAGADVPARVPRPVPGHPARPDRWGHRRDGGGLHPRRCDRGRPWELAPRRRQPDGIATRAASVVRAVTEARGA